MPAKPNAVELAHQAGRAAYITEPPERRHPDACPFGAEHPDEREAWLDGFGEALEEAVTTTDLRKALEEAR